jgi:hypothetical protein
VKKDLAEAARLYRKAAEAGLVLGQNWLGYCYFNGEGVEQNYSQAIEWYRKAADRGESASEYMLAYCYEYGRGVNADLQEAARWYRKAADHEDADAQFALGYCYEHGRGVGRDIEQAKHWYRKAADQEHRRAVNALDRLLNDKGILPKPDHDNTKRYWVIAPYSAKPVELWQQVWQYDLANNIISIGWTDLDDISCLDEERLRAAIDRTHSDDKPVARGQYFAMLWSFFHKIKIGDVIIARHGVKKLAGVGTVIRTAYFDPIKPLSDVGDWFDFANHLGVQWHDSPRDITYDRPVFGLQTVCQIPEERFRALVEKDKPKDTQDVPDEFRVPKNRLMVLRAIEALGGTRVDGKAVGEYTAEHYKWSKSTTGHATYTCCETDETLEYEKIAGKGYFTIAEKGWKVLKENSPTTKALNTVSTLRKPATLTVYGPAHPSFRCKGINMNPKEQLHTFVGQFKQQIDCLKDEEYNYSSLHVYVAGVPEPWEFSAEDEFDPQEEAGLLIVRDGPTDENDNAEVPEYVFRLDAISAIQLVSEE